LSQPTAEIIKPGTVLGERYEVVRLIDVGGMGQVYEARQLGLEREVAIKVLDPRGRGHTWEKRFLREVAINKQLTHPNTIRLYDAGQTRSGRPFLVMELLNGETLDRVLRRVGRLPVDTVTRIGRQALKSLIEAHGQGIVHRDIKPSNIMLCEQLGEQDFIKVVDFGVARITGDPERAQFRTEAGVVLGTAQYMSPEQALGEDVDRRSDLFSLGMTLYELVTGALPYTEESPIRVAIRHSRGQGVDLPPILAETPLGRAIAGATLSDREARFDSAGEMLAVLDDRAGHEASAQVGVAATPQELVATAAASESGGADVAEEEGGGSPTVSPTPAEGQAAAESPSTELTLRPRRRARGGGLGLARVNAASRRYPERYRTGPLWVLFGLLLVAAVSLGIYLFLFRAGGDGDASSSAHGTGRLSVAGTGDASPLDGGVQGGSGTSPALPLAAGDAPSAVGGDVQEEAVTGEIAFVVESSPSGALVKIDGRFHCQTPCDKPVLAQTGRASVTVSSPGFKTATVWVELTRDVRLSLVLTPLPEAQTPSPPNDGGTTDTPSAPTPDGSSLPGLPSPVETEGDRDEVGDEADREDGEPEDDGEDRARPRHDRPRRGRAGRDRGHPGHGRDRDRDRRNERDD
jgi:serine/threonine-protein kinase